MDLWMDREWFLRPIHKRGSIRWLACFKSKEMGSLGRAKRILEPRFEAYALTRGFLDLKILMDKRLLCNPWGIGVTKLQDHTKPSGPKTGSRIWSWSTNRTKGLIFFWYLNAMNSMRTLTQVNLGKELVLQLGLAISWDSTAGFSSNLEDL